MWLVYFISLFLCHSPMNCMAEVEPACSGASAGRKPSCSGYTHMGPVW